MLLRRSALSSGERTFLIGANEARVPGDIGREDRGEPSLDPFFAQGAPDQRRACSPNALVREEFALSTDPNQPQGAKAAANSLDEAGYRDNQEGQQLSKGSHPRRREPMTVWGRVQKPMRGRAELRYRRLAGAVTLPTDFRLPPENGHSRYALWTARFAPKRSLMADSRRRVLSLQSSPDIPTGTGFEQGEAEKRSYRVPWGLRLATARRFGKHRAAYCLPETVNESSSGSIVT